LIAGGSVAECYFVDQEYSWPYVVQRVLGREESLERLGADHVHVGNIGRSLVTCRQIDYMLSRLLDRYPRLDAIVFMVGASDLVYWLERRAPREIEEAEPKPSQVFAAHPEGPFGWTPRTLALRRIASHWRRRLMRPIEVRERAGKRLGKAREMRARAKVIIDQVPDPKPLLDHFDRYLRRLIQRARAHAPVVILARQPWLERRFTPEEAKLLWNFGAGRPYEGEVTTYYSHDVVWKLMHALDRRASEIARELGVPEIDMMSRVEPNFENYYDELHFTPKGCGLIGQSIARALLEAQSPIRSSAPVLSREPHPQVT
jgi:lysophospholipase L1-like esterase